jgi:hypothetical protein
VVSQNKREHDGWADRIPRGLGEGRTRSMLTRDSREGSHTKSIHVQMGWISSQVQQSTGSREEGAAAVGGGSGREREGTSAARGVGLIDACAG